MATGYLRILGLPFRIDDGSSSQRPIVLGALDVSRDGSAQDSRRDNKQGHRFTLTCSTQAEAEEAASLIDGEAHVINFDDGLEASSGMMPLAAQIVGHLVPVGGLFGGAWFQSADEFTEYPPQLGPDWTILARMRTDGLTDPWKAIAIRSDGDQFLDGVKGAAGVDNTIDIGGGNVRLNGTDLAGDPNNILFNEIMIVPFALLDATIVAFQALDEPLPPMPDIHVRGDAVQEPLGLIARGESGDAPYLQAGGISGLGFQNNAMRLDFALTELANRIEADEVPIPVAYWTFDAAQTDPGAPEVRDVVNAHHGTLQGGTTSGVASGRPVDGVAEGEALLVPLGSGQGVAVPDAAALDIVGDLSIACWINVDALVGVQTIVEKFSGVANGDPYRFSISALGELHFVHETAGGVSETILSEPGVVVPGVWVWAAVTRRVGVHVEFWINGGRDIKGRQAAPLVPGANAAFVAIGDCPGFPNNYAGRIDHLALWNTEHTSRRIVGSYLATARGARYRATG